MEFLHLYMEIVSRAKQSTSGSNSVQSLTDRALDHLHDKMHRTACVHTHFESRKYCQYKSLFLTDLPLAHSLNLKVYTGTYYC